MIDQSDQAKEFVNENIPILYKPKVHYSVHRRPQLDALLSRTRQFENFASSFPSISFKTICSLSLSFQKLLRERCQHALIRSYFVAMICDKEIVL